MNRCVLIIEDEAAQAQILKYNLESAGFDTLLADNGTDGIGQARSKSC